MKKKKNYQIQKIFSSATLLVVAIITFIIGCFAVIKTSYFDLVINFSSEKSFLKFDNIFLNLLYVLLSMTLLYFINKVLPKINKKFLLICTILFSLILGFWWVNYVKIRPISDQSMVIFCAEKLLDNDLPAILEPGQYLNRNPHQLRFHYISDGNFQDFQY